MHTADDIIESLKNCVSDGCKHCSYARSNCQAILMTDACTLIEAQRKEIERLRAMVNSSTKTVKCGDCIYYTLDKTVSPRKYCSCPENNIKTLLRFSPEADYTCIFGVAKESNNE